LPTSSSHTIPPPPPPTLFPYTTLFRSPMNPAPPVTSSFILAPRDLPDVLAGEVPREPTLVARRRLGREVQVGEIDDASRRLREVDRKSTRLNSSHGSISYAVFCLKKKT